MKRLAASACIITAIAAAMGLAPRQAAAATPQQVDAGIKKGVAFLYSKQNADGNWEKHQAKPNTTAGHGVDEGQWGGRTALCTYALLAAGENPLDERIVKATKWLREAGITGHYSIGVRANVWLNLPQTDVNKQAMTKETRLLITGMIPSGPAKGLYAYLPGGNGIDLSCAQYGVLGLWAAAQRNEVQKEKWKNVEDAWRSLQGADGSWAYRGKPTADHEATIQMTAAGVATLFITQEYLHADDGIEGTRGNIVDPFINKGLNWVAKGISSYLAKPDSFYAIYGIERIGVASGYKYFGDVDWFQVGADKIIKSQKDDGSFPGRFGPQEETCFALLFLSRGRAPVMMNKLQYNITAPGGGASKEANWNQRPRDAANITRWVEQHTERKLNWQIVNFGVAKIDDLHDSSILYVAGNQKLFFSDKEKAMLKQYVEEGGMIVGNADAGRADFANAFRALGKELFPSYEFKPIMDKPEEHPLLTNQTYQPANWKKKPKVEALSNGARVLMVLLPSDDVSKSFQRRDTNRAQEQFELFANLHLYATDKTGQRYKGEYHVVRPNAAIATTSSIKLARIKYAGNWDPEPAGWNRLSAVLQNENKIKLETAAVEPGKDALDGYKVAHLTGTGKFTLTDAQRKALGDFVQNGGLLIVDACGGSEEFNVSANDELVKLFPNDAQQLATSLKKEHALYTAGGAMTVQPRYRVYALTKVGDNAGRFLLKGIETEGKLRVVFSQEDLSVGLVGNAVDGIIGYDPSVATPLMKRILMLKNEGKI